MSQYSVEREAINQLIDNIKPSLEKVVDPDLKLIINTLIAIIYEQQNTIEMQRKEIEELKEKLHTNSDNSSKPPSSDPFKSQTNNNTKKHKRKQGGQQGHIGITRDLIPENEVDHIKRYLPPEHCACGGHVIASGYQRHQVHDIPPVKPIVTEHQLFYGYCDTCRKTHTVTLPDSVPTGMLGPCLLALIATLGSDYKLSKRDIARFLMDFYQLSLCIATVKRAEETVSTLLAAPVEEAKKHLQMQPIVNADETSHAECGKKMWTWVAIAGVVAVFLIAKTRSAKSAKELLGAAFQGILGSDRYSAYLWIPAYLRQICWAHLKRDFKKISERAGKSKMIGLRLLVYQKRLFLYWHQVRDGTLTREQFKQLMMPIRKKVEELLLSGTLADHKKTQGTCLSILKIKVALWTFIETAGVEPTNNIAERVLRKIVIWRKVCFGTWSANGTIYLGRIMTVVATCRLQNRSVYGFLCETIQAQLDGKKAPSLLPVTVLNEISRINAAVAT